MANEWPTTGTLRLAQGTVRIPGVSGLENGRTDRPGGGGGPPMGYPGVPFGPSIVVDPIDGGMP